MLAAAPAEPSTLLLRTDMNEAIRCMHVNFQRGMLHHSINTMHFFIVPTADPGQDLKKPV